MVTSLLIIMIGLKSNNAVHSGDISPVTPPFQVFQLLQLGQYRSLPGIFPFTLRLHHLLWSKTCPVALGFLTCVTAAIESASGHHDTFVESMERTKNSVWAIYRSEISGRQAQCRATLTCRAT